MICGVSLTHPVIGEVTTAQIFVACLGASNYTFVETTASQTLPNWLGSHQRALEFFGGVSFQTLSLSQTQVSEVSVRLNGKITNQIVSPKGKREWFILIAIP